MSLSIYRRALGADFERLHPRIQERLGFSSEDGVSSIGRGVMEEIWHGPAYTVPILTLGATWKIAFPERGREIPFTIENYAYRDKLGRETMSWIRAFHTPRLRHFDAYMIYSEQRGGIIDYLGSHQHIVADLHLSVEADGGFRIRSGAQRLIRGRTCVPIPAALATVANVHEHYDEARAMYHIDVHVSNRLLGPMFGYHGWFTLEWRPICPEQIPAETLPMRTERLE